MKYAGIDYSLPKASIMQATPLLVAEYAGRTAYDSFANSEHENIRNKDISNLDADSSELLNSLAWVHHHHSVLEHLSISYLIEGTSRGVLQEIVRHRIASYTVRSTRYTMSSVINAFVAETVENISNTYPSDWFVGTLLSMDLFVTTCKDYNRLQVIDIFNKLSYQIKQLGYDEFISLAVAKSSTDYVKNIKNSQTLFNTLEAGKKKRNVADPFKMIVNDAWKVDMVVTFNLRSLKNYFQLRDSGAAYFLIRELAKQMKAITPAKYLDLIVKK